MFYDLEIFVVRFQGWLCLVLRAFPYPEVTGEIH